MDLQLNTKTAIVTAATAGIDLAIARTLAQEGVAVTITGRDHKKLAAAVATIEAEAKGASVTGVLADVSTVEGVAALTAQQPETDILINNLGFYEATPFAEITDEAWLRMFEVNVMSGVRLSRHYFPQMLTKNWGRVIFISSEVGAFTPPDMVHYGMSKSAQLAVARGGARHGGINQRHRRDGKQRIAFGHAFRRHYGIFAPDRAATGHDRRPD